MKSPEIAVPLPHDYLHREWKREIFCNFSKSTHQNRLVVVSKLLPQTGALLITDKSCIFLSVTDKHAVIDSMPSALATGSGKIGH